MVQKRLSRISPIILQKIAHPILVHTSWILAFGFLILPQVSCSHLYSKKGSPEAAFVRNASQEVPNVSKQQVVETHGKLPLSFEANQGQTNGQVKFLSRGSGYMLFLTPVEAVLALRKGTTERDRGAEIQESEHATVSFLKMKLLGVNKDPIISGLDQLPGKSNYIIGNDPAKWRTDIPHYAKVHYNSIYPGIDLL